MGLGVVFVANLHFDSRSHFVHGLSDAVLKHRVEKHQVLVADSEVGGDTARNVAHAR